MTMVKEGIDGIKDNPLEDDFIYSQVQTNVKAPEGYRGAKRIIKNIKFANIENTLKMIREGAVGSTISNLDTYTSQNISKLFSIDKLLRSINGISEEDPNQLYDNDDTNKVLVLATVYDSKDQLQVGDEVRPTSYWSSRQRSTVTSYGTYATVNSIHDAIDAASLLNKVRPLSIRSMLSRNMLEIEVDGIGILEDELSVGDIIRVRFVTENLESKTLTGSNTERSGYYLIQNCRHIFTRERHDAILMICKVAQSEIVNDSSMDRD
jgi:hypothetical protein